MEITGGTWPQSSTEPRSSTSNNNNNNNTRLNPLGYSVEALRGRVWCGVAGGMMRESFLQVMLTLAIRFGLRLAWLGGSDGGGDNDVAR